MQNLIFLIFKTFTSWLSVRSLWFEFPFFVLQANFFICTQGGVKRPTPKLAAEPLNCDTRVGFQIK